MENNLFVGVSSGHTSSIAVAAEDSRIVGVTKDASLNRHNYSHADVTARLKTLLSELANHIGFASLGELGDTASRLVVSLPGVTTKVDLEMAELCVRHAGWTEPSFSVVDDTWAGLIGGMIRPKGICAFAGTGSSVFVNLGDFPPGKPYKLDGWGALLGDFGSGFRLSIRLFEQLGRALDQGITPPIFEDLLRHEPRLTELSNVQNWFDDLHYSSREDWRLQIAALAKVVTGAADKSAPDPVALDLVREAAVDIGRTTQIGLERFDAFDLPIVCQGGMFRSKAFLKAYRDFLQGIEFTGKVAAAAYRPAIGALLMSVAGDAVTPSTSKADLIDRILKSVFELSADDQELLVFAADEENFKGEWS